MSKRKSPNLSQFVIHYSDLPKKVRARTVPIRQDLTRVYNGLISLIKTGFGATLNNLPKLKVGAHHLLRRGVVYIKTHRPKHIDIHIKVTFTRLVILFFMFHYLWPHSPHTVAISPPKHNQVKIYKKVPQTALQTVSEASTIDPPQPTPITSGYGCGVYFSGDPDLDWIISRESGGNSCAVNPSSGACGVAQELPCGKSGCALGDGNCEISWMKQYCISRYGSIALARAYWAVHGNY